MCYTPSTMLSFCYRLFYKFGRQHNAALRQWYSVGVAVAAMLGMSVVFMLLQDVWLAVAWIKEVGVDLLCRNSGVPVVMGAQDGKTSSNSSQSCCSWPSSLLHIALYMQAASDVILSHGPGFAPHPGTSCLACSNSCQHYYKSCFCTNTQTQPLNSAMHDMFPVTTDLFRSPIPNPLVLMY